VGAPAISIRGSTPDGAEAEIVLDGAGSVALFFLTSSCYGCRPLWAGFASRWDPSTHGRVVLVTPSPSTESARAVGELAPGGLDVVMSSDAWHAYQVTAAPWFVALGGGLVVEDRPAPTTWESVTELVARAG
jgi:hypothetical protein